MIHISGIANPHIQDPRIANPLGRGSIIGLLGTGISVYQAVTATSTDACLEYSIDAIIGAAGAFCPELFGLPATLWFFGGKQVTYCYGSNVITPMIQNGINPGLMIYQPFK